MMLTVGPRCFQRPQELDEQLRHSLALIHMLFIVHENCMSPLPKVPCHKVFKVPWRPLKCLNNCLTGVESKQVLEEDWIV